ncbi:MAG: thioredoxin family protein, partial [Melioribacteraceae bacterium]|nr:thioredoxin family protein [Melioribacteraceae bacterium]
GIDWCGRCRLMSSLIEEVIAKCTCEIVFVKIDMEQSLEIKEIYNVYNKPTYLVFKQGKIIDRIDKLISKREFQTKINSYINE